MGVFKKYRQTGIKASECEEGNYNFAGSGGRSCRKVFVKQSTFDQREGNELNQIDRQVTTCHHR